MNRTAVCCWAILSAAVFAGCQGLLERDARILVVPASMPGKVAEAVRDLSQKLLKAEPTHLHRRLKGHEGIDIDVWVLRSRWRWKGAGDFQVVRGTVICLHPLLASKTYFLALGRLLARQGWDVVLMDLRAHGRSGGKYVTWGAKEKYDVKRAVDQLLAEGTISERIYVCGSSLGGTVAIQYAAIDPRCRGVLALAPPASALRIGRRFLPLLSRAAYEAAWKRAGEIAGFDPAEASAEEAARKLTCPLRIVHGWLDLLVPYRHSQDIIGAAAGPKKLIPLILGGHVPEIGRSAWVADQIARLETMEQAE